MWSKVDRALLMVAIAGGASLAADPAAAADKNFTLADSGKACIFDLTADANGTLTVLTKAKTAGAKWRSTAVEANLAGAVSAVGTGSTGSFTGKVTKPVVKGHSYEVIINYERPLPGTFPSSATAQITGPFANVPTCRPVTIPPTDCTQISESAGSPAAEVDTAVCGSLFNCKFEKAGDTDLFNWTVPAGTVGWIKIAGPSVYWTEWCLRKGTSIVKPCQYGLDVTPTLSAGTYSILTHDRDNKTGDYTLSVQGVSGAHTCGKPIACGDERSSSFNGAADTDTFKLATPASRAINIKIVGPNYYSTNWCVFDPTGKLVDTCHYGENTVTLPKAGTYTIGVHDTANRTGAYSLSLQCL